MPAVVETGKGLQVVAPDSPYVAAIAPDKLYFIDTRFDVESASHIKEQIEMAMVPHPDNYISINEISATAELKSSKTGETIFVFNPAYARVLFAKGMNRRNPELKIPEHKPAGDWLVTYDLGNTLTKRQTYCADYGCEDSNDCTRQTYGNCALCHHYYVDNECETGLTNAIGVCIHPYCSKAVDTPREDGESDASYYQRMDRLHWGHET